MRMLVAVGPGRWSDGTRLLSGRGMLAGSCQPRREGQVAVASARAGRLGMLAALCGW
jgi:hypothetical protein